MQMTPPSPVPTTPLDSGQILLKSLEQFMSPQAMTVLRGLLNWADMWDSLHSSNGLGESVVAESGPLQFKPDIYAALLAPFGGFGSAEAWNNYSVVLSPLIVNEIMAWTNVPEYRAGNTMSWCVLKSVAPVLSLRSHGAAGSAEVAKAVHAYYNRNREYAQSKHNS